MHIRYSDIVAGVTGYMGQRASSEKDLGSWEGKAEVFKTLLVEMDDEHCDSGF